MDELTPVEHIRKIGTWPYTKAYVQAMFEIRQDRRLVGLDKVRRAIAQEAALRATGFPVRPFKLPRTAGKVTQEILDIIEEVLPKAIRAAKGET